MLVKEHSLAIYGDVISRLDCASDGTSGPATTSLIDGDQAPVFKDLSLSQVVWQRLEDEGLTWATSGHLVALNAANKRIVDLDGIGALTGLRFLDLSRNHIEDVSPLKGLTKTRNAQPE